MYMADLARSVSHLPIGGLLLEEEAEEAGDGGAAYRTLVNVARHYRWGLALRGRPGRGAEDFDTVISCAPPQGLDLALGLDVSAPLWSGGPVEALGAGQFYFAEIPVGTQPEAVLQNLARLRA